MISTVGDNPTCVSNDPEERRLAALTSTTNIYPGFAARRQQDSREFLESVFRSVPGSHDLLTHQVAVNEKLHYKFKFYEQQLLIYNSIVTKSSKHRLK